MFEASLDKKFLRPHLNQQAGYGGVHLSPQLLRMDSRNAICAGQGENMRLCPKVTEAERAGDLAEDLASIKCSREPDTREQEAASQTFGLLGPCSWASSLRNRQKGVEKPPSL
jgi:hypothetical protein